MLTPTPPMSRAARGHLPPRPEVDREAAHDGHHEARVDQGPRATDPRGPAPSLAVGHGREHDADHRDGGIRPCEAPRDATRRDAVHRRSAGSRSTGDPPRPTDEGGHPDDVREQGRAEQRHGLPLRATAEEAPLQSYTTVTEPAS
jgi:hypothetical protein